MTIRTLAAVAALAVGALAPAAACAMEPEAAIKYRQQVMKAIGGHTNNVVMVLKGEVPYQDQLGPSAQMLADSAKLSLTAFEEDTSGADIKTTAKDDIWQNWDKFSGGLKKMEETTAQLASAVQTGDKGAIGEAMQAVGETCKGCHDNFRTE